MMLTQLARVARRTGYPVTEVPGWQTRGHGPMSDIRTVTAHHTANGGATGDYPSLRVVRDGRPGLDGPLAQYGLGRSGRIYVIAAGLCYHAGVSRSIDYTNSHAIGIEAEAVGVPGTASDWPPAQRESYRRLCKALYDEFGPVQIRDILGHKETCAPVGRKSDPDFGMAAFRDGVAAVDLSKPPKELAEVTPEDILAIQKMVRSELAQAVTKLRAEFVKVLTVDPLLPNKPTRKQLVTDPAAKAVMVPVGWLLTNIETDQDNDRDEYLAVVRANTTPADQGPVPPPA